MEFSKSTHYIYNSIPFGVNPIQDGHYSLLAIANTMTESISLKDTELN